ncbi:MAG: hypothetical protein SGPRY_001385 [Prymnesium sp.]
MKERTEQSAKAELPIKVTLGMAADARFAQREKARLSIAVARGIETEERAVEPRKAELPTVSTAGIKTEESALQLPNARLPIEMTEGMITEASLEHRAQVLEETSKSGESVTLAGRREGQPKKIWAPVDVTLGMKADTSAVHLEKALRPIEVARGMETEEREVQRLNAIGLTDVTTGREMVVIEEQLEKAESPIESARGMSTDSHPRESPHARPGPAGTRKPHGPAALRGGSEQRVLVGSTGVWASEARGAAHLDRQSEHERQHGAERRHWEGILG